ncbi:hypothetical protein KKA50_02120 [Patescibacteria group bacterium]|nr:hypothetical protein [Patescibacteria group bacterium]
MPEDQNLESTTDESQIPGPIINVESELTDSHVKLDPSFGDKIALTHIPDTVTLIDRYGGLFDSITGDSGSKWFYEKREPGEINLSNERFLATKRDFPFPESTYPIHKLGDLYALKSKDRYFNIWDLNLTDSPDDKNKEAINNGIRIIKHSVGKDSRNLLSTDVTLPSGEEVNISLISYTLTGSYIYDGLNARHPGARR